MLPSIKHGIQFSNINNPQEKKTQPHYHIPIPTHAHSHSLFHNFKIKIFTHNPNPINKKNPSLYKPPNSISNQKNQQQQHLYSLYRIQISKPQIKRVKKKKERDLEGVFVTPELAELTDDAVEIVLANSVAFFFPFPNGDDGAAFCVHQTHKPPTQCVSAIARAFR